MGEKPVVRVVDLDLPRKPTSAIRTVSPTPLLEVDLEARGYGQSHEEWKPQKQEWFIMISLAIISLMVALDATILVTVLPTIAKALEGSSIDAFWAGTSFLLSSAVFQPVIASVSEVFGRQQLLLLSLTFFTVGTILCAISTDFTLLLVGRSIQGVGGGGIITMSQVIFCDIVPLRQRPKYFSIVLGAWSVGSILGPVVGGALCQNSTWRWVFYINFPFCFLGFVLGFLFVRLDSASELTVAQKLRQTDWLGAVLFLGGMSSALIGLSWGGIQYSWVSAQTLVPIIVGGLSVAVFVAWQLYVQPKSLLPMSIFASSSAVAAFYCALVNGLILFTALYYVPFFCMSIRSSSPTKAGIDLFPALFFLLPGSILVSVLTTRLGQFRWAIWSGWAIGTVGCGLFFLFDLHTNIVLWAVALSIFGIGTGMVLTSVNVGIQAISKAEDCAMAASMYGFMRSLGMPLGVAVSGTVFQNAMSARLALVGLPTAIAHDSERYIHVLHTMDPADPKRVAILDAYLEGFRGVWLLITLASASALAVSIFIKKHSMNKVLLSKYTAH
ncbi:major facilitator superfamily domain-containing protein [Massariosphaeria phaeospora]|uniref:Major facilitator superfamily domain-containing protein n=1 Tax=Massariosphaeria phaeospora TaxID=100035 RepID=A0A7C8MG03_9PLEO|nr:major facilitator superfamily domain-containing protein [Massariosphaeria phaeospora]